MPSAKTIMASATDSQSTCGSYIDSGHTVHASHGAAHSTCAHCASHRAGRLACSRFSTKTPVCACARSCRLVDSGLSRSLICSLYSSRYDARTEQVERRPSRVHCAMVAKSVPRVRGNRPEGPGSDHGGAYVGKQKWLRLCRLSGGLCQRQAVL